MAKTTCKLCSRRFASPRALAGHMRSHSVAAAAAKQQISSASSASTSFTAAADGNVGFKKPVSIYALRENPKRSLRVSDGSYSDRESEAESTPPRGKRAHAAAAGGEAEPVSSLSDAATPEEDVALALMMLSRDTWQSAERGEGEHSHDEAYALPARDPAPAEKRTKYQCGACKKVFRSYQALGGHRASHVRGGRGGCCAPPVAPPRQLPQPEQEPQQQTPLAERDGEEDMDGKGQQHECPYCFRVFGSGQALGGHKRSHMCTGAAAAAAAAEPQEAAAPPEPINVVGLIDLNMAPPEDVELSAVSDPRFPNPGS